MIGPQVPQVPKVGCCPVCGARFRATRECSRCGTDLGVLMGLQAQAFRLRQQARDALLRGDFEAALEFAGRAQQVCATEQGRRLCALARMLDASVMAGTATTVQ